MKRHIAALTALLALACTLTACGHEEAEEVSESSREASSQSTAEPEETTEKAEATTEKADEPSGITFSVGYESVLEALIDSLNAKDYDTALSIMYPESYCKMMKYIVANDDEFDELKDFFEAMWDEDHPLNFKEIVSEEILDDSDKEYFPMMIDQTLYCSEQLSDYYTKNDAFEEFDEKLTEMMNQAIYGLHDCPELVKDYRRVNFVLTDKKGIDFDYEAGVYLIDGEGWRIYYMEDLDPDDWSTSVLAVSENAYEHLVAANDAVISAVENNINGIGDGGFTRSCIISPDKKYCCNIDADTAAIICSDIAKTIDDAGSFNYFVGVIDGQVTDLILCFKGDTNVVCSYPTGIIQYGENEEDYENASALNFDEAYKLYVEKLENRK